MPDREGAASAGGAPAGGTPDYEALVRRHLPALAVRPEREHEIIGELAQLLEDAARAAAIDAHDPEAVARFVRAQVPEWRSLARELGRTRRFSSVGLAGDVRSAWRLFTSNPLLSATTVATLAIAIGLNTAVFSLVNALLFRPLGVDRPEQLVRIYSHYDEGSFLPEEPLAHPDLRDLGDGARTLAAVAACSLTTVALEAGGETTFRVGEMATGNYFQTLAVRPALGRLLAPADDPAGAPQPVVVLGHDLWSTEFGGRSDVVGTSVRVNGRELTIIGVAPATFRGLMRGFRPQLWLSVGLAESLGTGPMQSAGDRNPELSLLDDRDRRFLWGIGRRYAGSPFSLVRDEVARIGQGLAATHPKSNAGRELLALPLGSVHLLPGIDGPLRLGSAIVLSLVGLVLLIACANLASLLLARAAARGTEMATRLALGASRARIVRQLLIESLALAGLGAAFGLLLARLASGAFAAFELPTVIPLDRELRLDGNVLWFTLAVAGFAALAFGLMPALTCARTEASGLLRAATVRGGGRHKQRLLRTLVVVQVALSALLLVCAGLVAKSARNAALIPRGLEPRGVTIGNLDPERQGRSPEQSAEIFRRLLEEARAQPEVSAAAYASHLPLTLWINTWDIVPEHERERPEREWYGVDAAQVGASYFETAGVPLLEGRSLVEDDVRDARRVTVVNRAFAERFFPGRSAVGARLLTGAQDPPWDIVGVVATGKYRSLGVPPRPFVFMPLSDPSAGRFLVVRFSDPAQPTVAIFRRIVSTIDPHLAVVSLATLERAQGLASLLTDIGAGLFALFGTIGLFLAMTGLYGVLAYTVAQRTHELGIRVALGAASGDVLRLVAVSGLRLLALGLALGLLAAAAGGQALRSILYGMSPLDPTTFAWVAGALLLTAGLACLLPALRALRIDPRRAMRHD